MRCVKLAHLVILGLALGGAGPVLAQDPVAAEDSLKAPDAAPVPSAGEAQPETQPQSAAPPSAPDPVATTSPEPQPAPMQAQEPTAPLAPESMPAQTQDQTPSTPEMIPKIRDRAQTKTSPQSPPPAASRFSFDKVSEGFVRLDNESGQIAYCSPRTAGWSCEAVPEDSAALERAIGLLRDEIAALKREVAAMVVPPPPPPPPSPPPPAPAPDKNTTLKLPTQDDLARAGAYVASTVQDTWRRLVEMIAGFQKDVMRKS